MKRILLIDDDKDLSEIIEYILKSKGFVVYLEDATSSNFSDVVGRLNPDIILLDVLLYGKSGTEICKELKRKFDIPILLFTADTKKGEAFADCDADGFIPKPFNIPDLIKAIHHHLKLKEEDNPVF